MAREHPTLMYLGVLSLTTPIRDINSCRLCAKAVREQSGCFLADCNRFGPRRRWSMHGMSIPVTRTLTEMRLRSCTHLIQSQLVEVAVNLLETGTVVRAFAPTPQHQPVQIVRAEHWLLEKPRAFTLTAIR